MKRKKAVLAVLLAFGLIQVMISCGSMDGTGVEESVAERLVTAGVDPGSIQTATGYYPPPNGTCSATCEGDRWIMTKWMKCRAGARCTSGCMGSYPDVHCE